MLSDFHELLLPAVKIRDIYVKIILDTFLVPLEFTTWKWIHIIHDVTDESLVGTLHVRYKSGFYSDFCLESRWISVDSLKQGHNSVRSDLTFSNWPTCPKGVFLCVLIELCYVNVMSSLDISSLPVCNGLQTMVYLTTNVLRALKT